MARKLGQLDFGSLGASCELDVEIDGDLFINDIEELHSRIQAAYRVCRQAVDDELGRQNLATEQQPQERRLEHKDEDSRQERHPTEQRQSRSDCHNSRDVRTTESRGGREEKDHHPTQQRTMRGVTNSQVRALHAIASRHRVNLSEVLKDRYQIYRVEDLSITQASRLIDELNATHGSHA
ncbi:MAG: hypothetical protein FJ267_12360 [Planctomycetes bacterium]|nr:hypothetical protein [Planctomycetota bacterium]